MADSQFRQLLNDHNRFYLRGEDVVVAVAPLCVPGLYQVTHVELSSDGSR